MAILTASVGETSATINYALSNSYTGDSVSYSWRFSKNNVQTVISAASQGSFNLTNLARGSSYAISAQVTITVVINPTYDEEGNKTSEGSETPYSETATLSIYTHPGPWSWGASKENIIVNTMTQEKLTEWKIHFQNAYHWKTQSSTNYDLSACDMPLNKVITAAWYNACANALNTAFGKTIKLVNGLSTGATPEQCTLISDTVINKLNFSGLT